MKRQIGIITMAIVFLCANVEIVAQELRQLNVPENETKEEKKAREKRLEELRDSIAYVEAEMAIDSGYFVIVADRITFDRSGTNIMSPESGTNFVLVQGDKAIIQLAFNNGFPGLNGLGGITVEGVVSSKKKKVSKKGDIYYDFSVTGAGISAQVSVTVYHDGNKSSAYISPNFHSNKMTVYGPLIPYNANERKDVFVGRKTL